MPTPPKRPKYDPRIEQRYGALVDSLVAQMGHAPDSLYVNPALSANYGDRGETRGNVVTVASPNDPQALFHELGHFWSSNEQNASRQLGDSTKFDPYSHKGGERLADTFAALLRSNNDTTNATKDVKLLARILARQRDKQNEQGNIPNNR